MLCDGQSELCYSLTTTERTEKVTGTAGVISSGVSVLGFSLCQPLGNAKLGFTGKCACWFPCLASFEEFFVHVCRREEYFLDSTSNNDDDDAIRMDIY